MKKVLAGAALAALSMNAFAADYSDGDIHKNDYSWSQFNLMWADNQLPQGNPDHSGHDYMEMEFGGRSGIWSLYGYVDVFNLTDSDSQDFSTTDGMFMKFNPRMSLDALTGIDMSVGPVKEVYFSTLFNWSGDASLKNSFWGVGADVDMPWLGTVGVNLYGLYDIKAKDWDGYQLSANWFKPFYFFENKSFISFQGYFDYQWGIDEVAFGEGKANQLKTDKGGAIFLGLYWHSDRYAVGYGLKGFDDVYGLQDGGIVGETTGWANYFSVTYKF
ncbi:outer membrane protein OmpK [Ferrimonas lipolytica]|uniref:Nucleoside-specific channel-forming protein n=1 Tax=Ferrimonas lipolytica TaxID=2724191 RepID=A0A6H1UI61_9GAMM|nr:outer membrane protein OmpK [Ferrimonas lipolytica]QIZ78797.1 hypothetical protein HER31_03005 [Ferrimonas lipolytica]